MYQNLFEDQLVSITDDLNGAWTFAYDAVGNLVSKTNPRGKTTTYTYDNLGRLLTETDPLSNVRSYAYDLGGRLVARTDPKSQVIEYTYNDRNELTRIDYPDLSFVSFAYNDGGARTQMVDATGTTAYSYDALYRLTSVTFPGSRTVSYGYDAASRRTSITYPGGSNQASYTYDAANRLTAVTGWDSNVIQYAYDDANRMTSATLPLSTGIVSAYTYDGADRLTGISHVKDGSTTVASVAYTLDGVGNRTQRVDQQGTHTYAYDDLYRLTSVTYPGPSTTSYAFDAFGNRTSMTTSAGTTAYTYDGADRITQVQPPSPAPAINYTWDDNGNLVERGSDTFGWDYEDRMVEATVNSVTSTFAYRGDGLRDSRTVGMSTTTFTWDINAGLPVVLDDGNQYLYGAGLSAMKQSGNWFYYLADGLGSTMAVVDSSGVVQKSYQYDVYGEVTGGSGSLANEFDFAGQQTDGSTGLQYLRARYYDPETGVFLSREPLAVEPAWLGGAHSYSNANSCNLYDPSGLAPVDSDPGHGGGGRSDCGGLWSRIKNHVFSMIRAATNWRAGNYGNWHVPENRPFTPKERVTHYAEWNRHQQGLKRALERWGGSGRQKPCGPPPGGFFGTLTMLVAEYLQHKTLDETAGLVNVETDGRTKFLGRYWSWKPHWPDLPEVSDQDWPIGVPPAPPVPIPVP